MDTELPLRERLDPLTRPLFKQEPTCRPIILVDTSTLIYLDRLVLLETVLFVYSLQTIPQVIEEFGLQPDGLSVCQAGGGETDLVLVQVAVGLQAAILSEDKQILQAARRQGLDYYNSLMVILALYYRNVISRNRCDQLLVELQSFAHYDGRVWAYGRRLLSRIGKEGLH